jgi:hypothetical protein|tara:strand:+ start:4011 stop:4235 length:225 start_codon:yes stop_codon:yes gene_type:complete
MILNSDTFLKWTATVILIIGTGINALGFYPAGPVILVIGSFIWLIVSCMWNEPALIVTNLVLCVVGAAGLLYSL